MSILDHPWLRGTIHTRVYGFPRATHDHQQDAILQAVLDQAALGGPVMLVSSIIGPPSASNFQPRPRDLSCALELY